MALEISLTFLSMRILWPATKRRCCPQWGNHFGNKL